MLPANHYFFLSLFILVNWLFCWLCMQWMITTSQTMYHAAVCLSLFSSKQCIIKQLLDWGLEIPAIINVLATWLFRISPKSHPIQCNCLIDLVTVFDATLTSRRTREKLQCLYENLVSNNFRKTAVLKKNNNYILKVQSKGSCEKILEAYLCLNFSRGLL